MNAQRQRRVRMLLAVAVAAFVVGVPAVFYACIAVGGK